jgi:hypothetical protein
MISPRTQETPASTRDHRAEVFAFLTLLSKPEIQARQLASFTVEERPAELLRLWLDEVYVPSERYLDELKGDFSAEASAQFFAEFSEDELKHLQRFHQFLQLRIEMLPKGSAPFAKLASSPSWEHIVKDGRNTLELLKACIDAPT